MISFTDSQRTAIIQWLNGSKEWFLKTEIKLKTSTYIYPDDYNVQRDLDTAKSMALTGIETLSVDNVRIKLHGLGPDLKYRVPELSFIWHGYSRYLDTVGLRRLRFFLEIRLEKGEQSIVLLRTDWYKIKSANKIHTTANVLGADAEVKAIPWVYEYNEKLPWIAQSTTPGQEGFPEYYAEQGQRPTSEIIKYWDTLSAMLVQQRIFHNRRRVRIEENGSWTLEPDSPCPFSGPFVKVTEAGRLEQYMTSLSPTEDWPTEGGVPFKWCLGTRFYSIKNKEMTLLSAVLMKGMVYQYAIIPHASGGDSADIIDAPLITLDDISNIGMEKRYSQTLNDFEEIPDTSADLLEETTYLYEFEQYSLGTKDHTMYTLPLTLQGTAGAISFQGWVDIPELFSLYTGQYEPKEKKNLELWGVSLKDEEGNYLHFGDLPRQDLSYEGVLATGSGGRYYKFPGQQSGVYQVDFSVFPYPIRTSKMQIGDGRQVVKVDLLGMDRVIGSYKPWNDVKQDVGTLVILSPGSILRPYTNMKKKIKFSAEWRPWVNINDIIKVTYFNDYAERVTSKVLVLDIDANVSTLSAEYTGVIIE